MSECLIKRVGVVIGEDQLDVSERMRENERRMRYREKEREKSEVVICHHSE